MSDYTYPDEFVRKAQSRIRKQMQGNGVDPKDITLNIKRQGMGEFTAETAFQLDMDVQSTESKGRKPAGEQVEPGQMDRAVQGVLAELKDHDTLNDQVKELIKKLPFQGFGAAKQTIPISSLNKVFSELITCNSCQGQGKSQCGQCRGRGRVPCHVCNGTGLLRCPNCNGTGEVEIGGKRQICPQCQGRREIYCYSCQGQREVTCNTCQAKGMITCPTCNGEGANTRNVTITPFAVTQAAINLQDLDYEPKSAANKIGAMILAKGGHMDVAVTKPPVTDEEEDDRAYYQDAPEDKTKTTLYYAAKIPWAVGEILVKTRPYNITFLGKKGAVADSQHFMNDLFDEPFNLLQKAAAKNQKPREMLAKACQTARVSRETLSLVMKKGRKKAMHALHKSYGIGLTKPFIQNMVQAAYQGLNALTRKWRMIGFQIALMIAPILSYIWFYEGYRAMVPSQNIAVQYGADAGVLMAMMITSIACIKLVAWFPYRTLASTLNIPSTTLPPAGRLGHIALGWSFVSWVTGMAWILLVH